MFRIDRYHLSRKTALLLTADVALATAVLAAAYVLRRETDPALVPFAIFLAGLFLRFIPERRAPRPVLVLGGGRLAAEVADALYDPAQSDWRLSGLALPENAPAPITEDLRSRILGRFADLERIVEANAVERIVVALEEQRGVLPVERLRRLRARGVRIEDAYQALTALTQRRPLESLRPSWFVFSEGFDRGASRRAVKRTADVLLSAAVLLASLPLMVVIACLIWLDSPGPALFRQRRVGLNGAAFELLKFRTMRTDAEADGVARWTMTNDPRITGFGRFLRKYRLDELPQLINVLRGEMSLVGPRPERPEFVEMLRRETPFYDERHAVRPGVTGWAQVCYPYAGSVPESLRKLEYDLYYVQHSSLRLDLAIFLRTAKVVLLGRGR